jgi:Glycosyltransferase 61
MRLKFYTPYLVPWLHFAKQAFQLSRVRLSERAIETVIFSEATSVPCVLFYFQDAHVSRIRDSPSFDANTLIETFFKRTNYLIPGHSAYRVKNSWLIDGSIFPNGTSRIELRDKYTQRGILSDRSLIPLSNVQEVPLAVLTGTAAGSSWFGHWLEDELPLVMRAQNFGPTFRHSRQSYGDEAYYLERAQLAPIANYETAHFDDLWIIEDNFQNPNKVQRYLELRKRFQVKHAGSKRVYLHRGNTGNLRCPTNEKDLLISIEKEGFVVLDLARASAAERAKVLGEAELVVSIEGSHLAHALYLCPRGAQIVVMAPPNLAHTTIADLAPFFELTAAMYVCEPQNADGSLFCVNAAELFSFIDVARKSQSALLRKSDDLLATLSAIPQIN